MHFLDDLCSKTSLRYLRQLALVTFIYAIGCSEDTTNSTEGNIYGPPSGGTPGLTGGVYSLQTGGFSGTTASGGAGVVALTGGVEEGVSGGSPSAQTGGVGGGTGGVGIVDASIDMIPDSSVGDGSSSIIDAGGTVIDAESTETLGDTGISTDTGIESYSPCPTNGEPCKILPLGDSITYGIGFSGGYRVELFGKALAAGKNITFLGSLMNGPQNVDGVAFPRNNEGHSGWTISQLANIVPSPALDGQPDIILLMIGTNDMYRGNPATAPDRLTDLINEIIAFDPDTLLVVSQLTPLSFSNAAVEAYNAALPAIIDGIAATGRILG